MPHAGDIRIIVKKAGLDAPLSQLLPFSFELPIDGVIHHVFEQNSLVDCASVKPQFMEVMNEVKSQLRCDESAFNRAWALFVRSFSWYSGCPAVALFIAKDGRVAVGSMIESSAYNPTVNPLQVCAATLPVP